jgi:hypothetical protein
MQIKQPNSFVALNLSSIIIKRIITVNTAGLKYVFFDLQLLQIKEDGHVM